MSDGDFNDKGVAQAKDKLNGKAQPSSQRAARRRAEKTWQRNQEVADLLLRVFCEETREP